MTKYGKLEDSVSDLQDAINHLEDSLKECLTRLSRVMPHRETEEQLDNLVCQLEDLIRSREIRMSVRDTCLENYYAAKPDMEDRSDN